MKNIAGIVLILGVFWIINSGHFDPLLLGLGAFSVVFVVLLNRVMTAVDGEHEPPILLSLKLPGYLLWLVVEIIKSNIDVVKLIWQPKPAISPTVFKLKASQKSDVCKVLYANSITLTPGTITLEIQDDEFEVHALTRATAEALEEGEMDRRVRSLEE